MRIMATYEVGEVPERVEEERRRVPLLDRLGVPVVDEVDDVGVRRRPPWYWGWNCEAMLVVVGDAVVVAGKTPELVVREREWPSWASVYMWEGGRTETPGFAMGLRRTGMAPYAGAGGGCAIMAACMLD